MSSLMSGYAGMKFNAKFNHLDLKEMAYSGQTIGREPLENLVR